MLCCGIGNTVSTTCPFSGWGSPLQPVARYRLLPLGIEAVVPLGGLDSL
jgi:hypothetical protein